MKWLADELSFCPSLFTTLLTSLLRLPPQEPEFLSMTRVAVPANAAVQTTKRVPARLWDMDPLLPDELDLSAVVATAPRHNVPRERNSSASAKELGIFSTLEQHDLGLTSLCLCTTSS